MELRVLRYFLAGGARRRPKNRKRRVRLQNIQIRRHLIIVAGMGDVADDIGA